MKINDLKGSILGEIQQVVLPLRRPTADTGDLVTAAVMGLSAIYRPGFKLAKAGVMLLDLQNASCHQIELDLENDQVPNRSRLMTAMDAVNQRFGKGALHMASDGMAGDKRVWAMKQERLTPGYTTRWADILEVRA